MDNLLGTNIKNFSNVDKISKKVFELWYLELIQLNIVINLPCSLLFANIVNKNTNFAGNMDEIIEIYRHDSITR